MSNCTAYVIGGFFGGLWFMYTGLKKYLLLQKIRNTPTSKVHSAAVGLVELYGAAKRTKNLVSPISREKCAYWRIIAEWYKSGKRGGWRKFYDEASTNVFYLKDDTGKILVDPAGANVDIPRDKKYSGYVSGKGIFGMKHKLMEKKVLEFINRSKPAVQGKFMAHRKVKVRIHEHYIAEDDKVYVMGDANPIPGKSSSKGYENLIIKKGKYEKAFYISDSSEKEVVSKMDNKVSFEVFGGFGLSTICLLILILMYMSETG